MIEKIQIIGNDFKESLEGMSYETVGRLFMGALSFANDEDPMKHLEGDQMAKTFFPMLKGHIERHEEFRKTKVESGRKGGKAGGAPIGNSNAKQNKAEQSETNQNKAKQSKTKQNKPPIPNPIPSPIPNPIKRLYGECQNVKLTEEEYNKIVEGGHKGLIDELSLYIASKGDKYKSHYATILQWAKNREKDKAVVIKDTPFNTGYMRREQESNEELEKKFIKNL